MNPANPDFANRTGSSPALFNRCVIDWFGDWSDEALWQVAKEFTLFIDPDTESFENPRDAETDELRKGTLVNTITYFHKIVTVLNKRLAKSAKKFNYITPRDFLDFINQFKDLQKVKSEMLSD